jgi:hypothetical protein
MEKGTFDIKHYGENDLEIVMDGWREPRIYNTGDISVLVKGILVGPGDEFGLGATGVDISQSVNVSFSAQSGETGTKKYAVIYNKVYCKT